MVFMRGTEGEKKRKKRATSFGCFLPPRDGKEKGKKDTLPQDFASGRARGGGKKDRKPVFSLRGRKRKKGEGRNRI